MNNRVVRNAGWMIGARVLQMLLGIFITAWTSRYLGPANMGSLTYVSSFVSFFSSLATLGLNNIIVKELIDHKGREHYVLGTTILMRLISSISSGILVLCIIRFLNPKDTIMMWTAVLLSLSLVAESFEMIGFWYQSRLESKTTSIIQTIAYLTVAGCRLIGLATNKDVLWFAFATSLDSITVAVLLYAVYKKGGGKDFAADSKLAKEMFARSRHFIYSGLMVAIYSQMDSIMIKEFMDTSATGYYSTATGINTMWSFILVAIIDSVYPTIVEAKRDGNIELYHKRIVRLYSIVFWVSTCASILIMFLSDFIILLLYGSEYLPSADCLKICTWINTFAYLGVARGAWMVCENNQVYQKYILGMGAAVNLLLNYLWIPKYGIAGAACATLITQVVTSVIGPLVFKKTRENTLFILKALNPGIVINTIAKLCAGKNDELTE